MVEQRPPKPKVEGSIPFMDAFFINNNLHRLFRFKQPKDGKVTNIKAWIRKRKWRLLKLYLFILAMIINDSTILMDKILLI